MRFSELLLEAAQVPGIKRVRFTTSHPRDFGSDIIEAMDAHPAICNHVHLPVQSGSTRVLREMQRTYSREEYLEKIALIRGAKRRTAITTDVIVGFPGETDADFDETLSLLDEVKYDGVYSFKYSPRPNTPASSMADAIPEEEKSQPIGDCCRKSSERFKRKHCSRWSAKSSKCMSTANRKKKIAGTATVPATGWSA